MSSRRAAATFRRDVRTVVPGLHSARARATEAALRGQPWTEATVQRAMQVLRQEFSPISDLRASSAYRVQVLGNLLQRFWLETQGQALVTLEALLVPL